MAEGKNKRFFVGGSDVELLIFLLHVPMHFPVWCHDIPSLLLKFWVLFLELGNLMMGRCSILVMLDKTTNPAYARLT
jgi:hypothetical protein